MYDEKDRFNGEFLVNIRIFELFFFFDIVK